MKLQIYQSCPLNETDVKHRYCHSAGSQNCFGLAWRLRSGSARGDWSSANLCVSKHKALLPYTAQGLSTSLLTQVRSQAKSLSPETQYNLPSLPSVQLLLSQQRNHSSIFIPLFSKTPIFYTSYAVIMWGCSVKETGVGDRSGIIHL